MPLTSHGAVSKSCEVMPSVERSQVSVSMAEVTPLAPDMLLRLLRDRKSLVVVLGKQALARSLY